MNAVKIKLPFGLNERNKIVHIADVERDNNCNYICPSCRSPLIPVQGKIKEHHFRHEAIKECEGGLESAIHLAAKQIIMERKKITLPKCLAIALAKDSWGITYKKDKTVVEDGHKVSFDTVKEEINLTGIRVDLLAKRKNTQLIIEIFYSHIVDEKKIEKIREANISAIEINLSKLIPENVKDVGAFWRYINDPKNIRWLYNTKATVIYQRYFFEKNGTIFSLMGANNFLKDAFIIPGSVKIIELYAHRYPDLIPAEVEVNFPSTLKTIRAYLDYLCEIKMLELTGKEINEKGNLEYKILCNTPAPVHSLYKSRVI
jgi:hypothetical protein